MLRETKFSKFTEVGRQKSNYSVIVKLTRLIREERRTLKKRRVESGCLRKLREKIVGFFFSLKKKNILYLNNK